MPRKLRIAIDCRITNAQQGIGTAVLSLAKAFSDSGISEQEYTFVVREDMLNWLAPYVYGPCKLHGIPVEKSAPPSPVSGVKAWVGKIKPLQRIWHKLQGRYERIPASDGYVESQNFDIVHFPTQTAYLTELASIYQPWDLQHLHHPEFFSKEIFSQREREYRAFCNQAAYVCVQAEWTKRDVIRHYQLNDEKVAVIPWGSVLDAYQPPSQESADGIVEKFDLPQEFFFYPAVTWPHKNHEVILRALHILKKDCGIAPPVYFSGRSTSQRPMLDKTAADLGVSEQIHYVGFLTSDELQVFFREATAMLFPSKFEGFGLPILEAFHARVPVICSNATTLPEVAGDAALYFSPDCADELADAMKLILESKDLREEMVRKGSLELSRHSIEKTAKGFQELYLKTFGAARAESRS